MKNVTLYTKPSCPHCILAKNLLRANNIEYKEIVVGEDLTREQVIAMFPNQRTVPIIIVDGEQTTTDNLKMLLEG